MRLQQSCKIITCILPKGRGISLLKILSEEKNVHRAAFAFARGFDIHDVEGRNGIPDYEEKEVVKVIAGSSVEAEDLFDFIFRKAGIDQLGGGIMTMAEVKGSTEFMLPDIKQTLSAMTPEA